MPGKTKKDVEDLKKQWEADPCFHLADTPGFSRWKAHLASHERVMLAVWRMEREKRAEDAAKRYGFERTFNSEGDPEGPDLVKVGEAFLKLEDWLFSLERRIDEKNEAIAGMCRQLQFLQRVLGVGET